MPSECPGLAGRDGEHCLTDPAFGARDDKPGAARGQVRSWRDHGALKARTPAQQRADAGRRRPNRGSPPGLDDLPPLGRERVPRSALDCGHPQAPSRRPVSASMVDALLPADFVTASWSPRPLIATSGHVGVVGQSAMVGQLAVVAGVGMIGHVAVAGEVAVVG